MWFFLPNTNLQNSFLSPHKDMSWNEAENSSLFQLFLTHVGPVDEKNCICPRAEARRGRDNIGESTPPRKTV
jgi:hypothetical protein